MANEQNLIPFSDRSEEEQREIRRKGGIASGAARRRKRELKQAADLFLSMKAPKEIKKNLKKYGIDSCDADMQMAMIAAQTLAAIDGNTKAAIFIASLLEDNHTDETIEKVVIVDDL